MKEVIIVHAVDTEGPLHETVQNKFDRIDDLFGIKHIKPTTENLDKLLKGKIKLGNGIEKKIIEIFSSHLANYNNDWSKIDKMMSEINSDKFRKKYVDSFGSGWKFTWHCLDHVNYKDNPRRRTMGNHAIFDYYNTSVNEFQKYGDSIQWHFHPMSTYNDAHRCATSYFRSGEIYEILARKIIERNFFPSAFRAGFQAERPDSNWFLEQFIPFDITNMAIKNKKHFDRYTDFKNGRSGNWRNAPYDWSIYHPDHDDYQLEGNCRRWIGRALNIMNRIASINQYEMDVAFKRAHKENKSIMVGVTSHDFRNLVYEVDHVYEFIKKSSKKYKDVKIRFLNVENGFRRAIYKKNIVNKNKIKLELKLMLKSKNDYPNLLVKAKKGDVFGPQPFLAIETRSRRFLYDNLDFVNKKTWAYAFHPDTLPIEDVKSIGIAANDKYGNTSVVVHKF